MPRLLIIGVTAWLIGATVGLLITHNVKTTKQKEDSRQKPKITQETQKAPLKAIIKESVPILLSKGEKSISWYSTGTRGNYTACYSEYRYKSFKVTYLGTTVVVFCNDTGHFKEMGRVLDLSAEAFKQLAPLSKGILHGATVQIID